MNKIHFTWALFTLGLLGLVVGELFDLEDLLDDDKFVFGGIELVAAQHHQQVLHATLTLVGHRLQRFQVN